MKIPNVTIQQLLEAGVHLGHKTLRWNTKNRKNINLFVLHPHNKISKNSKKNYVKIHKFLERKMDRIFINFLKHNNENGQSFIRLASNLNGNEFQSFMMGESNLLTKLKIIKSMPKQPFIKELLR